MAEFVIKAKNTAIRFRFYKAAPQTVAALLKKFPFSVQAVQAREAGEEIWIPDGPALKIPLENASVFLKTGEIGIAPVVKRNRIPKSIAIVYGEAKLYDAANIFGTAVPKDIAKLKKLGKTIWLKGSRRLRFELNKK